MKTLLDPTSMSKELFGTDGIRGVPGKFPLDVRTLYWIGRSLGEYVRASAPGPRVLIGMDTRESGLHIAGHIAAGLSAAGGNPAFAGAITPPGGGRPVRAKGFCAGGVRD